MSSRASRYTKPTEEKEEEKEEVAGPDLGDHTPHHPETEADEIPERGGHPGETDYMEETDDE